MSERRDLVAVEKLLPAVRQRMEVAEFVADSLELREIEVFFMEFPVLFLACLQSHYPLSSQQIQRVPLVWQWRDLLRNEKVAWEPQLVLSHQEYFKWQDLHSNAAFDAMKWETSDLDQQKNFQFWLYLSRCGGNLSPQNVRENRATIDFPFLSERNFAWSAEVLEEFKSSWDWESLSSNGWLLSKLNIETIARYADQWDWEKLSANLGLDWSVELLDRFADYWDWEVLSQSIGDNGADDDGEQLPSSWVWTIDALVRYEDRWDWDALSMHSDLPWTAELIFRFVDYWNWCALSDNQGLPWSVALIDQFSEHWDWLSLSQNEALPWNIELVERYQDMCFFHSGEPELGGLSQNRALPWTLELIERFEGEWDWDYLSSNSGLPWSLELIEKFEHAWWWGKDEDTSNSRLQKRRDFGLSGNRELPWTPEFVERFEEKWDWDRLTANYAVTSIEGIVEKFAEKIDLSKIPAGAMAKWTEETLARLQNRIGWRRYSGLRLPPECIGRKLYRRFSDKLVDAEVARRNSFGVEKLSPQKVDSLLDAIFAVPQTYDNLAKYIRPMPEIMRRVVADFYDKDIKQRLSTQKLLLAIARNKHHCEQVSDLREDVPNLRNFFIAVWGSDVGNSTLREDLWHIFQAALAFEIAQAEFLAEPLRRTAVNEEQTARISQASKRIWENRSAKYQKALWSELDNAIFDGIPREVWHW